VREYCLHKQIHIHNSSNNNNNHKMLRTIAKRTTYAVTGTAVLGGTSIAAYSNTEQGKGFQRQMKFWSHLFPIIADYYINISSSSPYVKYQKYFIYNDKSAVEGQDQGEGQSINAGEEAYRKKRKETLEELHAKHAPEILQTLLSLKGLYIKLGQVLSVSVLPIPKIYKEHLRTLQSDVPGFEDYDTVIKATIEKELNQQIEDIFDEIEPIPCGAASIGQAHRARLKKRKNKNNNNDGDDENDENADFDVVIKVQYPHASWQVPADIECIGQFLAFSVWADIVDETSAKLSYDEFSRQFLSELDYSTETENLKTIYESSLDQVNAPYFKRNVVVPKVYEDFCSDKVITMEYLPGPKMEEEARKQLESLGIRTDRSIKDIVKEAAEDASSEIEGDGVESGELVRRLTKKLDKDPQNQNKLIRHATKRLDIKQEDIDNTSSKKSKQSWKASTLKFIGKVVGVDNIFWIMRTFRQTMFLSQASTVLLIQSIPSSIAPISWNEWAKEHQSAAAKASRMNLTKEWIDALFDVHGHQIFTLGCFNADCHPGNILVVEDKKDGIPSEKLGLIDFGQCKRLTSQEQLAVAKLILSVANNESDIAIANNFREMGVKTKEDSTEFLANFSRLMFGSLTLDHMDHKWHMNLHKMDQMLYFPKELSMVYRTSLLLRGLAISLQINCSISEQWKSHAQAVVDRHNKAT
jgi:predicted unusual protein kinase regulating ubiquinone biosynthesis (AarF/ABC1/UbiB family)